MGNVGVVAERILRRDGSAQLGEAHSDLWTEDDAVQPGRLLLFQNAEEVDTYMYEERNSWEMPRHLTVHVDGAIKLANIERLKGLIGP